MLEELEMQLARHERLDKSLSVIVIDLNGFKALNDEHGHAAGDGVLRDVAAALERVVDSQDTLTRLGGDEFCVILPETEPDETGPMVNAIRAALASVQTPSGGGVTAGTGTASFPVDATSIDVLLHVADERLRENKPHSRKAAGTTVSSGATVPPGPVSERRQSERRKPR